MLILMCDSFDATLPEKLSRFGEVTKDMERLPEAHVALIRSKTTADKAFIDKGKNLKLIIRGGVGLDNVDRAHAESKGVIVKNTPEASSIAVAELAFAMMTSASSRIVEAHNSMVAGKWLKKELTRTELFGKTLGLYGLGRIAREVAKRALAFGMDVVAFDPYLPDDVFASTGVRRAATREELFAQAQYLSLHTPLTDETRGMLNKKTLSEMKKGVVIVNTCRGKVIVEEDMKAALDEGQVGAYCTDVWYNDPPQNSPLLQSTKCLFSPHIGASTKENLLRIGDQIEQLVGLLAQNKL